MKRAAFVAEWYNDNFSDEEGGLYGRSGIMTTSQMKRAACVAEWYNDNFSDEEGGLRGGMV